MGQKNLAQFLSYLREILMDLQIYISQDSVATQLKCGGIFSNRFNTNFS